jgi:hypothetical protein
MGRASPQTHAKRQREYAKKEKQRIKAEKRAARKDAKSSGQATSDETIGSDETLVPALVPVPAERAED